MEEKRKNRRMELTSRILLKGVSNSAEQEVAIDVTDVSKDGIGFNCDAKLEIGMIYEAFLVIWMKEVIHVFFEVVRMNKKGEAPYNYGAIFIGMPESDLQRIGVHDVMRSVEDPEK